MSDYPERPVARCRPAGPFLLAVAGSLALAAAAAGQPPPVIVVDPSAQPGGPPPQTADPDEPLIARVTLNTRTPCRGEQVDVAVTPAKANTGWVHVAIAGHPGSRRFLRFDGTPGPRRIHVVASTEDGRVDSRTEVVHVKDCDAPWQPRIRTRFHPYRPQTVDFLITNHPPPDEAPPRSLRLGRRPLRDRDRPKEYRWRFGDGTGATTRVPYVSHDYGVATDASQPYHSFGVAVQLGGDRTTTTWHVVTLHNNEYYARRRGLVYPRVATAGLEGQGRRRVGSFRIRNLEDETLIFQRALRESQYCDPERASTFIEVAPSDVILQGGWDEDDGDDEPAAGDGGDDGGTAPARPPPDTPPVAGTAPTPPAVDPAPSTPATGTAATGGSSAGVTVTLPPPGGSGTTSSPPPAAAGSTPPPGTVTMRPGVADRVRTIPGLAARPGRPPLQTRFVIIPGGHTHAGWLTLEAGDLPDDVCGLGFHLIGSAAGGREAYASLYFEVRRSPHLTVPVADAAMVAFLDEVVRRGWIDDENEVTQRDLYRLRMEGKVRRTAEGWEIEP